MKIHATRGGTLSLKTSKPSNNYQRNRHYATKLTEEANALFIGGSIFFARALPRPVRLRIS